jgi:hypothetical protein
MLLVAAALAAGCATKPVTKLDVTWVAPQLPPEPPKQLLIISVAGDEFFQIAFQDQMAAELKARGVNAVASKRYFTRYTTAERERFKQSIEESGADFVLIARVTTTDDKALENRGTFIGSDGMPYATDADISGVAARYFNPSSYVAGTDGTETTVTAEASIFARNGKKLIWSARTRTTDAQSRLGSSIAPQYVEVLLEAMKKDKLFTSLAGSDSARR